MKPLAISLRAVSLVVLAIALFLVAAGGRASSSSYYPLRAGMHWQYEVANPATGQTVTLTVTNLGRQSLGRLAAAVQRLDGGGSVGYRYTVERPDSISTVAERGPGKAEPTILEPPATLLRLPVELGQTWTSEATTTQIRPGTKLSVSAKVASLTDEVETPAGKFDGCVRVESTGTAQVPIPESETPGRLGIETRLWYARDVGVVKIERREFVLEPEASEVSVTYRLIERGA